jgi:hypothetical protein
VRSNTRSRYRRDAPIAVDWVLPRRWRAKRSPKCVLDDRGAEELCPARDRNQYLGGPGYAWVHRKGQADECVVSKDAAIVVIRYTVVELVETRTGDQF